MSGQLREAASSFVSALALIDALGQPDDQILMLSATVSLIEVYNHMGQPHLGEPYIRSARQAIRAMKTSDKTYALMYVGFISRLADHYAFMGNINLWEQTLSEWAVFAEKSFGSQSTEYVAALKAQIGGAFRSAQINLKSKRPAPYYWGAFVLTGY